MGYVNKNLNWASPLFYYFYTNKQLYMMKILGKYMTCNTRIYHECEGGIEDLTRIILFGLILYFPSTIFQLNRDGFLGWTSTKLG